MPIPYNPGYSDALRGLISEPLGIYAQGVEARKRREEYKRQNDLLAKRSQMVEDREQQKHGLVLADRNEKLFKDLSSLTNTGQLTEAEALAKSSQYIDPKTGEMRSIQFDRGQDRLDLPSAAPQLSMPTAPPDYNGFQNSPAGAALPKLKLDANVDPAQTPAAPNLDQFRRPGLPSITTPTGDRVTFDPEEGRRAKSAQAQERAQHAREMAARQVDPALQMAWLNAADREEAQLSGGESAQLRNREGQEDSQSFQTGQNEIYKRTAAQQQQSAMKPRGAGAGAGLKKEKAEADITNKNLTAETKYDGFVQKILQNLGYKEINTQSVKIGDLAANIAASDTNPAAAAAGKGAFVKLAQGGTGVISDSDMDTFWNRIGGLGMRAREAWQGYVDGTLPSDKKAAVASALHEMESRASGNMNRIGKTIADTLPTYPGGAERVDRYVNAYAPGYAQTRQAEKAGKGDAAALDSLEQQIEARMKKRSQ